MMGKTRGLVTILLVLLLSACVGMPETVKPVQGFDLNRYLGKWYEIARLDHPFERGLERISAEYTLRDDGGVSVINRGYSVQDRAWKRAEGKAYFVAGEDQGYLKVSFFGPFYGAYVIFELDHKDYEYAFVSGPDRSYLWLLARTPHPPAALIERFKRQAAERGFASEDLIFVDHEIAVEAD